MTEWQAVALTLYAIPVLHRMTEFRAMSQWARDQLSDMPDGERLSPFVVPVFAFAVIALWPLADLIEAIGNIVETDHD